MRTAFLRRRRFSSREQVARAWPRFALALLGAAALSSCSVAPSFTPAGFEAVDGGASAPAGPLPMAELPSAGGAVVAVFQTQAHDVLTQRIVLKGDPDTIGENAIVVRVNQTRGPWDIDGPVGLPTKASIAAELDQDFAGVDMQISNAFERNSFGPFGYATGHPTPQLTCVYAWEFGVFKGQKLGDPPEGAPSMPLRPTSVRVRLCRSKLGEAEIVSLLRALQVYPPDSRVAYVEASYLEKPGAGDALAAAGVGRFGVAEAAATLKRGEATPKPARHRAVAERRRRRDRADDVDERAAAIDPPDRDAVNVPMPASPASAPHSAETANPLLAPLAAAPKASGDDMPLPKATASAERPAPAPAKSAFVPLPN